MMTTKDQLKAAPAPLTRGRVAQLDSLRGYAAATVVWHHWREAFWVTHPKWYVYPLFAGHDAVILFFVLSGYVLSLPTWAGRAPRYGEYLVRRISRIYLPYVAAAALAGVGCYFFWGSHLPLTGWFNMTWQRPLSWQLILQQLLMDPSPALNTAFWSLRYEMEMSLIFPFVCALMLWMGRYSGILLVVATKVGASLLFRTRFGGSDFELTLYYAVFFVAGAALARERELFLMMAGRLSKPMLWVLAGLALVAYYHAGSMNGGFDGWTLAGVSVLIILIQDKRLNLGLETRVAEYLGRVSYSSYLVHGTVLFAVLNLLYGKVSMIVLGCIYAVLSYLVAHIFCVTVEEPSQQLGKRIAGRMRDRNQARVLRTSEDAGSRVG